MLTEGLREKDLEYLVSNYVSIDQYTSKLDDDNITVAFFINEKDAAEDLRDFIEKVFYIEIRDIEISDSLTDDNKYILFVEFERNINFPKILLDMISSVTNVTNNKDWKFKTFGMNDKADLTIENIKNNVRLSKIRSNINNDEEELKSKEKTIENTENKKVEESFKININDRGWKRTYLPEGYVSQEEFNKLINESETLNSRDPSELYLIENQYPEYEVITTDANVFLIKGDKILKFK